MHQIKRILHLLQSGTPIREAGRVTGLHRNTVRSYLLRFKSSGLSLQELSRLADEDLRVLLGLENPTYTRKGRPIDERFEAIKDEFSYYATELGRRGVTRSLLWAEYRERHPDGYGYSQFCLHLADHCKQQDAPMVLPRNPGEQLQVDFAGGKLSYVDQQSGEVIECPVLVCAMPYSHFIYVRALHSERQEDFLLGLARALNYLGAIPQSIKVDNMRVAVKKSNRYEPSFTEAMEQFADHYGTTALAARVRKPKDKSSVEKAVDLSYKYIYAPLRDKIFTSLEALNAAIIDQVNKLNDRPLTHREVSRRQVYELEEVRKMAVLPNVPYGMKHVTEGKVQRNYHVFLGEDKGQYSVPYALMGKRLRIIYDLDTVEIYDGLSRVAVHTRNLRKNSYTTLAEHMPERHRAYQQYLGWDADAFRQQAQVIGPGTLHVIDRILASKHFQEQTFNRCLGVLRLANRYGRERLEKACQYLGHLSQINYGMINNVLKNKIDLKDDVEPVFRLPFHDQIRGPQNYR
jgi:transposase